MELPARCPSDRPRDVEAEQAVEQRRADADAQQWVVESHVVARPNPAHVTEDADPGRGESRGQFAAGPPECGAVRVVRTEAPEARGPAQEELSLQGDVPPRGPSPELDRPGETGNDTMTVTDAIVSDDGHSVSLRLTDMRPVHQLMIRMDITAADGTPYKEVTYLTVHRVPEPG